MNTREEKRRKNACERTGDNFLGVGGTVGCEDGPETSPELVVAMLLRFDVPDNEDDASMPEAIMCGDAVVAADAE